MLIYVVRHSFKNKGIKYLPGDLIKSPEDIKLLKCKVSEKTILVFNRQDPNTIQSLKVLGDKVGRPVLQDVKAYLAELDAQFKVSEEPDNKSEEE